MTYRPRWYPQIDGSADQNTNCGAASGGMLADRARKGVKPATSFPWRTAIRKQGDGTGWVTPLPTMSSAIRRWCEQKFKTDALGGLYAKWIRAALETMYRVKTGYAYGHSWDAFVAFIVGGRGCVQMIDYSVIQGTRYAASGFRGRHWVVVNERRYNSTLGRYEYLVFDPLADHRTTKIPQGPQWWPATLLRRAFIAETIYAEVA